MRLTPHTVRESIERLESLPFIRSEIDRIKDSLAVQQHKVNKVRNERIVKEGKLQALKEQLHTLEIQTVELTEAEVLRKETELTDRENILETELTTEETLEHMLNTRKTDLLFVKKLVGTRKAEGERLNTALVSITAKETNAEDFNNSLQTKLRAFSKEKQRANSRLETYTVKSYQELRTRGKLRLLLEEENRFKTEGRKTEADVKKLKRLENALQQAEDEERMDVELRALQEHYETEDRKFRSIQRVACVQSAAELEAYWISLQVSKKELEIAVLSAQHQIDLLERQRAAAEADLRALKISDSGQTRASDIDDWETKVKKRAKSIETTFDKTLKLRETVNAAIMIVAKMQMRLGEDDQEEVNARNVVQALSRCGDILLKIQETEPGEVSPMVRSAGAIENSSGKDGNGGSAKQSRGQVKGKSWKQFPKFLPVLFPS